MIHSSPCTTGNTHVETNRQANKNIIDYNTSDHKKKQGDVGHVHFVMDTFFLQHFTKLHFNFLC